jgi:hypothetical protein
MDRQTFVALGASNLLRGFSTVVNTARAAFGEALDVVAALGHGRSYGIRSSFLFRSLPGITESGLWSRLEALSRPQGRALITDVGNDILYHVPVETILAWVRACATRLSELGFEVVLTDLPIESLRRLSPLRFVLFRSVFVPTCRHPFREALIRAEAVNAGIVAFAAERRHTLVRQRPDWYGFDPIHIRPAAWAGAWRSIVLAGKDTPQPLSPDRAVSALGLYLARPERRWLFGVEGGRAQPALESGSTRVWLY